MQTFIIDHTDKKNKKTKKKNWTFSYTFKGPLRAWPILPFLGVKHFFSKNLAVIHNTTWAPNTMLNSPQKKLKSSFDENFWTEGRTDLIHMTLLAMARSPIRE